MASFQAKTGWKRPRKRENNIIVPLRSYPMRNRKFQKNNKKIKKYRCGFISSQNTLQKCCEREKIKIILPFHFYPTRDIKFQKNSKKIQKIKRYHYGSVLSPNWLEKAENV